MKSISSSIIVLAGVVLFTQRSELSYDFDDVSLAAGGIIAILGMIGWIGWIGTMFEK